MEEGIKILLVDDHPIILEGYKRVLYDHLSDDFSEIKIDTANTFDDADDKILGSGHKGHYDMVFLDINLPPSIEGKLLSGEDLGQKIKKLTPASKIIVITMISENTRLLNILRSLRPDGLLVKSDVTPIELVQAFDNVCKGNIYHSHTVQKLMRKQIVHDFEIDRMDREILLHLSKGVKTKDLPEVVPVSLASIEKRKKNMRKIFEVEDLRDLVLINKARELGFL